MLLIGHRGAAGLAPENTIASIQAAIDADADMVEIDVRLTKDDVPLLLHDISLQRTHKIPVKISTITHQELQLATKDQPIPTLEEVLKKFSHRILLNLELKERGSGKIVLDTLLKFQKKQPGVLDTMLFSSFRASELIAIRRSSPEANLALLHDNNPFTFVAYERYLKLSAVGFHRLHTNRLATEIAKKAGLFTYVYTVNRPKTAIRLARQGYDGVVTNYPDRIASDLKQLS